MRIAFSLVVKDDPAALPLLEMIRTAGFDGVEPTFGLEATLPTAADPRDSAEKLRALADRVGLKIPSMRGGPGFWPTFASPDPHKRAAAVSLAEKALAAVKIMGGDTLLIVPGQWEPDVSYGSVWKNAVETAKRIGEVAERVGINVGLENVENRFLLSPREWMQFLDEVNSPRVKMYFDAGNVVYLGLGHPDQWIRELGRKYITRIHFKDALNRGELKNMMEGEVKWPLVTAAMREIDHDDWIGIELALPVEGQAEFLTSTRHATGKILNQ